MTTVASKVAWRTSRHGARAQLNYLECPGAFTRARAMHTFGEGKQARKLVEDALAGD